jgi:hypothetical protein
MADKYPSISPYAYCAWNPVKLVDPNGREIDDYFSKSGKYLGSDNATTNNVRIMSEDIWNGLQKDPMGRIDKNVGYVLSTDFATASQKEMSDTRCNPNYILSICIQLCFFFIFFSIKKTKNNR